MLIRDERPEDASAIARIHYTAFKGHPVHPPGAEPFEHLIVERLRAAGAMTLSLVAEIGEPAGHIALSPARVGQDNGWLLLGPVGVLPPLQGQGIGSALVREALGRARNAGAAGVVLVGDPGFYGRFGFAAMPGLVHRGVPDMYVLALRLGGCLPRGEIQAHQAFDVSTP